MQDLRIGMRDPKTFLIVRTITSPYVYSSTVTIAEDENENATRLTICNLEDNMVDPIVTAGSILAIKQPCYSKLVDGGYHIRVDHPSDLVVLEPNDVIVPERWRQIQETSPSKDASQWKKEGDMMFLKKRFRKALDLYVPQHSSLPPYSSVHNIRQCQYTY